MFSMYGTSARPPSLLLAADRPQTRSSPSFREDVITTRKLTLSGHFVDFVLFGQRTKEEETNGPTNPVHVHAFQTGSTYLATAAADGRQAGGRAALGRWSVFLRALLSRTNTDRFQGGIALRVPCSKAGE